MADERRSITANPPRYPVVTGAGLIKMCPVAGNVGGALYEFEGDILVAPSHAKAGWVLLRDLYEKEGRMEHWAVFGSYVAAGKAGHERPAFPDEFLPAEVLKRRAGQTPGKKTWAPPSKAEARPAEETPKARRN